MSGFGFTEAQEMFRREVRNFAQKELAPGARERNQKGEFSWELMRKMGEVGLLGVNIPEELGGQGADWISFGIAVEEVARVDIGIALTMAEPVLANALLAGKPELHKEWVSALVRGEKTTCMCLTEPNAGSDATAIRTKARRDGNSFIIEGEKVPNTSGMHANAAYVFAKTSPDAGARGISIFLVPLDLPGVSRVPEKMVGWKGATPADIVLDNVRVPEAYHVVEEGKGFGLAMRQLEFTRPFLSLQALAMAQASLEEAINYAKERHAFGKPIGKFQGVSFKIAEDHAMVEMARLFCYRTYWLRDQGLPHTKEAAICKLLAPKIALKAIHDCLLIHGYLGYSEEFMMALRLVDCVGYEIADGTAQMMNLIISRELLGREFGE